MTKQQTVMNMAKFIQVQSLLLLDKLNEHAEHLYESLSGRIGDVQGGE